MDTMQARAIDAVESGGPGAATGSWWKRLLIGSIVVGLVWVAVIATWHANRTNPGASDLLLWLVALPAAVIAGFHLLRFGIRHGKARVATAVPTAGTMDAGAADDSDANAHYCLQLYGQALSLRIGANADDVLMGLRNAPRPGLHPGLKDQFGLPVFAAPVEDVDTNAVVASLQAMASSDEIERWDDEVKRALALLEPVVDELLQADLVAQSRPGANAPTDQAALPGYVYAHSRSVRAAPQAARPVLHVHLLLPAQWPIRAREVASEWIRSKAQALGHASDAVELDALPLTHAREVWRLIDRLGLDRQCLPGDRHLLLAAHSRIGAGAVEQLEQAGRLFCAAQPDGRIPGEAAAGLLLGATALTGDRDAASLQLHRPVKDTAPRDDRRRAAIQAAAAVCERALAAAQQQAHAVCALVSDADQRPSRSVEAAGVLVVQFPELEPELHGLHFGIACGDVGVAAPLVLLALAAAQAAQEQAPVVALSIVDDAGRVALTVAPSTFPQAAVMATAAAA